MLSIDMKLPPELKTVLRAMSPQTGRPASELAERALKDLLDDREDYLLAHASASEGGPIHSQHEVRCELGLDD
jgi:predicted DNA-binding protein